jgi:RNA ligase
MEYDLSEFEKRVEEGLLRKSEKDNLVLYGYTDACTFARAWDEYTKIARGLILNKETGEVVAKPFPKFFNLGEMEETFLVNLPNIPYTVHEKVDGSLGIVFNYNGEWCVSTRGSFYSDQAGVAKELLKNYSLSSLEQDTTLLVEIIYPENKIIVNYGDVSELVILGAFSRKYGHEYDCDLLQYLSGSTGMRCAKTYNYTIEQMIALQETMPKDEEGFVVRYENGLRVKIKGKEYLRIAKLMSDLSPIALWETMKNGKVDTFYLQQLPEELRADYEPYVVELERQFEQIRYEVEESYQLVLSKLDPDGLGYFGDSFRRAIGLHLKNNPISHSAAIFPRFLNNENSLNKYIMKTIRPDGNNMKSVQ